MMNQSPKDMGGPAFRHVSNTGTTPASRRSRGSNASRGRKKGETYSQSFSDSGLGRIDVSADRDASVADTTKSKAGNRVDVLPKMPIKLLPNFGEDPSRRLRKWNKAAERKLDINMEAMSQELKTKTSKLDRGIRNIEEELKDLDLERSYNINSSLMSLCEDGDCERSNVRFPVIPNGRRPNSRHRQGSGHKCSYNPIKTKQKCHHFPCVRPKTYHTIGYRGNPDFTSWMSWEAIKESWNAPELVDNVSTSVHDVKVSPRMLTLRKEEKLRKEIERRKLMNDMKRPQSWVTNYGQPMSYKQLKYPVRLYPIAN